MSPYPSSSTIPGPGLFPGGAPDDEVIVARVTGRLLDDLPPYLAASPQVQGVLDVVARELERLDEAVAALRENFWPSLAADLLKIHENLLGLAVEPELSLAQRRNAVMAFLQGIRNQSAGTVWEDTLTKLIGSGWAYEEHIPGDGSSPPENSLRVTLPYSPQLLAPASLGATGSGSGGTLAAGTYFYVVTAINTYGETEISNRVSATVTGSTSKVTLDWADVSGATSYGVYRSTTSGQERQIAVVTASTYIDVGAANGTDPFPTGNSTASPLAYQAEALAREITPAHIDLIFGYGAGFIVGVSQVGEEPL